MANFTTFTKAEKQVMEYLWSTNEAQTGAEIKEHCEDKIWKDSYIHILIKSLLEKEAIIVAGFKQTTKNYARTFAPAFSKSEYLAELVRREAGSEDVLQTVIMALIGERMD